MQISRTDKIKFNGIKLSDSSFKHSQNIVRHLESRGYNVLGHKTFWVNNTFKDKQNTFKYVRAKNCFSDFDVGVLFFPWSRETYLVSSFFGEQKMLRHVSKIDKNIVINLLF